MDILIMVGGGRSYILGRWGQVYNFYGCVGVSGGKGWRFFIGGWGWIGTGGDIFLVGGGR